MPEVTMTAATTPEATPLTLNEEVSSFLQDITGPDGARELTEFLMSERDKLARHIEEIDIIYSDPNDPRFCEIWNRQARLLNSLEGGLTLEQQDLLNDYRDALKALHVYYEKKAHAAGIAVGMTFLARWITGGLRVDYKVKRQGVNRNE